MAALLYKNESNGNQRNEDLILENALEERRAQYIMSQGTYIKKDPDLGRNQG